MRVDRDRHRAVAADENRPLDWSRSVGPGSCPAASSSLQRGNLVQPIDNLLVGHRGCVATSPFRFFPEERGIGRNRGVRQRFTHVDLTFFRHNAIPRARVAMDVEFPEWRTKIKRSLPPLAALRQRCPRRSRVLEQFLKTHLSYPLQHFRPADTPPLFRAV